jgi:hypothetical protein
MGTESLTERHARALGRGRAQERLLQKTVPQWRPGAYGIAPETEASSGRLSFPRPGPASIRWRILS